MSWPPPNYRPDYGTGYRVTFDDFCQLVSNKAWRPAIAPLLKAWFGREVSGREDPADLRELHERIQADPEMQYELYQSAMDLWR